MQASLSSGVEGPARLGAVLAGFRLLNTALVYDEGAAEAVNSLWVRERLAPVKVLLTTPHQRLIVLLQYIMVTDEDLQYEVCGDRMLPWPCLCRAVATNDNPAHSCYTHECAWL